MFSVLGAIVGAQQGLGNLILQFNVSLDLMRSLSATPWQTFRLVSFPNVFDQQAVVHQAREFKF